MIVSFYSYKGGVGRSQLCANIAAYLCYKKNKRVLLWDWDFEAPGLHYFFHKTNRDINSPGTIEMLMRYASLMRKADNVSEGDYTFLDPKQFVSLIANGGTDGKIDLIPAGNYNNRFHYNVQNFNWFQFYELLDGKIYVEEIKKWLYSLGYDYILIDSRTGISDYLGICNLQLPDMNIVVMAANNQSIEGCNNIITQILNSEYVKMGFRKNYILPVLSRINQNHHAFSEWAETFTNTFSSLITNLDSRIDVQFSKEVFKDFYLDKTLLTDEPQFSAGENILVRDSDFIISRNSLASKFSSLADFIASMLENDQLDIYDHIDNATWQKYAEAAVIALHYPKAAKAFELAKDYKKSIEFGGTFTSFKQTGDEYFVKGDMDLAARYYELALSIQTNFEVVLNLGKAYEERGDDQKALDLYEQAYILNSTEYELLFKLGSIYDDLHIFDKAIYFYQQAIAANPDDHRIYFNVGLMYDELQRKDEAIIYYTKAVEIKSDYNKALLNLGNALDDIGKTEEAIKVYENAINNMPSYHLALNNLANSYAKLGNKHKALEFYEKTLDAKPDYHPALTNWGLALFQYGHLEEAESKLRAAVDLGNSDMAYLNLGHVFLAKKNESDAILTYKKSLSEFDKKDKFWKDIKDDFKFLKLYGVSESYFNKILERI